MRIGYACISNVLRPMDIFTSRTATLARVRAEGLPLLDEIIRANLTDLRRIIQFNESRGIRFFRLSSGMFPHMSSERIDDMPWRGEYTIARYRRELLACGKLARELGHRLTMHPGQYVQVGSPREDVFEASRRDLQMHAEILSTMGMSDESVMVIHLGGRFEDRTSDAAIKESVDASLLRFEARLTSLSPLVRKYLVLENDEQWDLLEILPLCLRTRTPLVVDFFHHIINGSDRFDVMSTCADVLATWGTRRPKVHLSEQDPTKRPGAHSQAIRSIPTHILRWCRENNIDLMLEVKDKDYSVMEMYKKYFTQTTTPIKIGDLITYRVDWIPRE